MNCKKAKLLRRVSRNKGEYKVLKKLYKLNPAHWFGVRVKAGKLFKYGEEVT